MYIYICVFTPYHLFLVRAAKLFVDLQTGTSDMNLNTIRMTQAKVGSIMKRKHTQFWSTIPSIWTKPTIASHFKLFNTNKNTTNWQSSYSLQRRFFKNVYRKMDRRTQVDGRQVMAIVHMTLQVRGSNKDRKVSVLSEGFIEI